MQLEKGEKGKESKGVGLGSFALAENWREEPNKSGERTCLRFVGPGKTRLRSGFLFFVVEGRRKKGSLIQLLVKSSAIPFIKVSVNRNVGDAIR